MDQTTIYEQSRNSIAEHITEHIFINKGFAVYKNQSKPCKEDCFYAIDQNDLTNEVFVATQSNQCRNTYRDNGITVKAYNAYKKIIIEKNSTFLLFFIDYEIGWIYYYDLIDSITKNGVGYTKYVDKEKSAYPTIDKIAGTEYIFFSLEQMTPVRKLTLNELFTLEPIRTMKTGTTQNNVWDNAALIIEWLNITENSEMEKSTLDLVELSKFSDLT